MYKHVHYTVALRISLEHGLLGCGRGLQENIVPDSNSEHLRYCCDATTCTTCIIDSIMINYWKLTMIYSAAVDDRTLWINNKTHWYLYLSLETNICITSHSCLLLFMCIIDWTQQNWSLLRFHINFVSNIHICQEQKTRQHQ